MRGIFYCLAIPAVLAGCRRGAAPAADARGHLVLKRESPRPATLVDAAARVRYCARDSVLWLVAVGDRWTGAISMRTAQPFGRHFVIGPGLAGLDSAAIAARPIADSVGPAVIANRGTLEVSGRDSLAGRFTFETGTDSAVQHFSGTFTAARPDTTGCVATP